MTLKSFNTWRKRASRSFIAVKDYVVEAAPGSPSRIQGADGDAQEAADARVLLFPGWAARKYRQSYDPDAESTW